ncbi:hypothetical protein [Nostoc sp.]
MPLSDRTKDAIFSRDQSAKTLGAIAFEPTQDFLKYLENDRAKKSD